MKWFQMDSDTPNDPKIAMVIRQMGPAGFGALVMLWCHIADHGIKRPGWSINSDGKPMPEHELVEASHLSPDEFTRLVTFCTSSGHFLKGPWLKRRVVAIPAMIRRADTYTKRNVRRRFEDTSHKVGQSSSTRQDKQDKEPPVVPLTGGRVRRADRQRAEEIVKMRFGIAGCPHDPRCSGTAACVQVTARELRGRAS